MEQEPRDDNDQSKSPGSQPANEGTTTDPGTTTKQSTGQPPINGSWVSGWGRVGGWLTGG
jgi:hypothetical protein